MKRVLLMVLPLPAPLYPGAEGSETRSPAPSLRRLSDDPGSPGCCHWSQPALKQA